MSGKKVLIVISHAEPTSFSHALLSTATVTLQELGYEIKVSDLYAMNFDPVNDRRNYTSVAGKFQFGIHFSFKSFINIPRV